MTSLPVENLPLPKNRRTLQMRAAVLTGPRQLALASLPVPEPAGRDVRVRLEGCGICGSNLPPWEGRPWFKYPLTPGEPGHEGWGVVDAIGPDVTDYVVGDRVAILGYKSYAEYDFAPEENLVPLPPALNNLPFPGEALGCAWNVFQRSQIQAGETVAIVGIGFLGALLVQLAVRAGARVIAIGRRPVALQFAEGFGAKHGVVMDDHRRVIERVKELTDGKGCECVIEAVGQQWPLDLAAELTRERGRLIIAGYHQDGPRQVNMQLWNWRGLDVINAHERDTRVYLAGIQAAVRAVEKGHLDPRPLFTHSFGLDQLADGFEAMRLRPDGFMKALLVL
jgi:threonine dehydrogenase-like Zn-dependent dehydrogenase